MALCWKESEGGAYKHLPLSSLCIISNLALGLFRVVEPTLEWHSKSSMPYEDLSYQDLRNTILEACVGAVGLADNGESPSIPSQLG